MPRRWGQRSLGSSDAVGTATAPQQIGCGDVGCKDLQSTIDVVRTSPAAVRRKCAFVERGVKQEAVLSASGPLPAPEIGEEAAEYQARLRAAFLRAEGQSKEEVASALGRALGWVTRWSQVAPEEVPRPRAVPPYIAEYECRMLRCGVEPFRPPELRRAYLGDTKGLYEECAQQMPWRQAVFRKRNYDTGEVTVTNIASNRQDCSYPTLRTGIPRLDEALVRMQREFDIHDPNAYLLNNWYPDGRTSIAPHNHDFWSAILSIGTPRVFLLDGVPLLLGDGDLLVFGTQRHSVPKMPKVEEGRVSVAVFWYPEQRTIRGEASSQGPCAGCGGADPNALEGEDGQSYCEACWSSWRRHAGLEGRDDHGMADAAEADMLEAALQLSLVEQ